MEAYTPSAGQLARERAAIRARNQRTGFATGAIVERAPPPNRSDQSDIGLTDIAIRYWIEVLRPLIRSISENYPAERWLDEAKRMLARVGPPPEFVSRFTISIEWFKKFWKRFREKLRELTDKLRKDGTHGRPHGGPGSPTIPGKRDRGAWALGPALRGELLEAKLGKNTPRTFPYIDEWNKASGKAVSIKTTRLAGEVKPVENNLRRAVREISSFPLRVEKRGFIERDDLTVYIRDIKQRFLRVGYEPGTDTIEFKQMFDRIKEYATSQGLAGVEFIAVQ